MQTLLVKPKENPYNVFLGGYRCMRADRTHLRAPLISSVKILKRLLRLGS